MTPAVAALAPRVVFVVFVVLLVLVAALLGALAVGDAKVGRDVHARATSLLAASPAPAPIDRARLAALPPPVRRWLTKALGDRATMIRAVRVEQGGSIRLAPGQAPRPLRAVQWFRADAPAFLWWARLPMAPGVSMHAVDNSIDGVAGMRVLLGGLVPVVDAAGPQLDEGAAMRLLGEMVVMPTLALDPRYVTWAPIDDRSAQATLTVGGRATAMPFSFGDDDMPAPVRVERWRDVGGGRSEKTPWSGWGSDWRRVDGVLVPHRMRATWHLPDGDFETIDFTIERVEIDPSVP